MVHAADANAMVLTATLLRGEPPVFLRAGEELSVTGRCRAGSFTAARGALMAAYEPLQDALRPSPLEGRGRPIDLSFSSADARNLFKLLSEVGRVNIVLGPGELDEVSIVARHQPWDGVVRAMTKALGRRIYEHGNTWYIVDEGHSVNEALLVVSGPRFDVTARDVELAVLLAAASRVVPLSHRASCGAATVPMLRLRDVDRGSFLAAAALVSGASLEPGDPAALPCAPALYSGGDTDRLTELLAAVSGVEGRGAAVTRDRFGEVHLLERVAGSDLRIGHDALRLPEGDGYRRLELDPVLEYDLFEPFDMEEVRQWRLSATVITPSWSAAIVVAEDGSSSRIDSRGSSGARLAEDVTFEIAEGSVLFTDGADLTRLVLERAPR